MDKTGHIGKTAECMDIVMCELYLDCLNHILIPCLDWIPINLFTVINNPFANCNNRSWNKDPFNATHASQPHETSLSNLQNQIQQVYLFQFTFPRHFTRQDINRCSNWIVILDSTTHPIKSYICSQELTRADKNSNDDYDAMTAAYDDDDDDYCLW